MFTPILQKSCGCHIWVCGICETIQDVINLKPMQSYMQALWCFAWFTDKKPRSVHINAQYLFRQLMRLFQSIFYCDCVFLSLQVKNVYLTSFMPFLDSSGLSGSQGIPEVNKQSQLLHSMACYQQRTAKPIYIEILC